MSQQIRKNDDAHTANGHLALDMAQAIESDTTSRDSSCSGAAEKPAGIRIADLQQLAAINRELKKLRNTEPLDVTVRVVQAVAHLTGTVASNYEKLLVHYHVKNACRDIVISDQLHVARRRMSIEQFPASSWWSMKHAGRYASGLVAGGALVWGVVAVVMMFGATPLSQVSAVVNFGGKPAVGASVVLHARNPEGGGEASSFRGVVTADGGVHWSTHSRGDGLPPGEYIVTATWHKLVNSKGELQPGPNVLPKRYAAAATSPVRLVVDTQSKSRHASVAWDFTR